MNTEFRWFCSARLASAGDEFGVQHTCQARDDFVLHVEEIRERLVEPLSPQMISCYGVDQLDVGAPCGLPPRWTLPSRA